MDQAIDEAGFRRREIRKRKDASRMNTHRKTYRLGYPFQKRKRICL